MPPTSQQSPLTDGAHNSNRVFTRVQGVTAIMTYVEIALTESQKKHINEKQTREFVQRFQKDMLPPADADLAKIQGCDAAKALAICFHQMYEYT